MDSAVGFDLGRLEGQVDDHFICQVCAKVVRTPTECSLCEHLFCSACVTSVCPFCNETFSAKPVALFAFKAYNRIQLRCSNQTNGCEQVCALVQLEEHEKECEYVIVHCASPICTNTFMKKEKPLEDGVPRVCSVVCKTVVQFKAVLETKDQTEVLKYFHQFLTEAKDLVEKQVRGDLAPMQQDIDQKLQEAREYSRARDLLVTELEERKWKYHPGKWNGSVSLWTCCSLSDKFALGCRRLAA